MRSNIQARPAAAPSTIRAAVQEERRAEDPSGREAWQLVQDYLREKREQQVVRARQKLLKYDLEDTKRLRYRIELAHESRDEDRATLIHELKQLQDAMGLWHDRQDLYEVMAEAVARPELLLAEPAKVRFLLSELEKDRLRQRQVLEEIFRMANDGPARKRLKGSSGKVTAG